MRTIVPVTKRSCLAEAVQRWGGAAILPGHPSQPANEPMPPQPPSVAAVAGAEAA